MMIMYHAPLLISLDEDNFHISDISFTFPS